jgi:hypothetical protein
MTLNVFNSPPRFTIHTVPFSVRIECISVQDFNDGTTELKGIVSAISTMPFGFSRLQGMNLNMIHWDTFVQQLLLRKSNECYTTCVCVCVCVFVCLCVFVNLGIVHAMRKLHIVIFGLSRSAIYFTFSHKRHDVLKKKVTKFKMCALIFSTTLVWHVSHSKKKWARCNKKYTLADM